MHCSGFQEEDSRDEGEDKGVVLRAGWRGEEKGR